MPLATVSQIGTKDAQVEVEGSLRMSPELKVKIELADANSLRTAIIAMCMSSETALTLAHKLLKPNAPKQSALQVGSRKRPLPVDDESDEEEEEEDETDNSEENSDTSNSDSEEDSEVESKKRKNGRAGERENKRIKVLAPKYASCITCGEDFDINDNRGKQCIYHPGDKEIVEDNWEDHDIDCHGPYEDYESENPKGFAWTCCGGPADADACEIARHRQRY